MTPETDPIGWPGAARPERPAAPIISEADAAPRPLSQVSLGAASILVLLLSLLLWGGIVLGLMSIVLWGVI